MPKECAPESQKSPKRVRKSVFFRLFFRALLRLRGALFWHFWGPAPGYSFRTLSGLFRGSGPEGPGRPCVGRGRSQVRCLCPEIDCRGGIASLALCILGTQFISMSRIGVTPKVKKGKAGSLKKSNASKSPQFITCAATATKTLFFTLNGTIFTPCASFFLILTSPVTFFQILVSA